MNIQLINYSGEDSKKYSITEVNNFSNIKTFDSFDINIIDLNSKYIWRNNGSSNSSFNVLEDFKTISDMLKDSNNSSSKIIIILPQNIEFLYNCDYEGKYWDSILLKDMIVKLEEVLNITLPVFNNVLKFGKNETCLSDLRLQSDFYFSLEENKEVSERFTSIILSDKSKKIVSFTVRNKFYLTSLSIDNEEQLNAYLKEVGLIDIANQDTPEWIQEITKFDDIEHIKIIDNAKVEIIKQEKLILDSNEKLNDNMRYKSVLYTQGEELVSVITEILEQILDINLKDYEDELDADLEFNIDGKPYVVEIKGINSNVKTANLTQLLNHAATYGEKNDIEIDEIKRILIVNHQRKKPLRERQAIHEKQIDYARKRYDILIIETAELLEIFERYKNKEISVEDCRQMMLGKGLLKV